MNFGGDKHFETVDELIEFFLSRKFQRPAPWDVHGPGQAGYIFRGYSNYDYKNLPSAFREGNPLEKYAPQFIGDQQSLFESTPKGDFFALGMQLHSELRAVALFLRAADDIGIETAIDYNILDEIYRDSFAEGEEPGSLRLDAPNIDADFPPRKFNEAFALAQHHGVPTRFLDWTESPLVAAYFAAHKASSTSQEANGPRAERMCICFIHNSMYERLSLDIVSAPRHRNEYLRAQKGLFLSFSNANRYLVEFGRWPSVETLIEINSQQNQPTFGKATIPSGQADELLRRLWQFRISRQSMMPSLANAARAFQYRQALFRPR